VPAVTDAPTTLLQMTSASGQPIAKGALAREPYVPSDAEWGDLYQMLCGYCERQTDCAIVDGMIELKSDRGPWPEGGWVTDPGADVTCLSFIPRARRKMPRQQIRQLLRQHVRDLPPVCAGCAARRGSEASVSLHTRREYQKAVQESAPFGCHEDPNKERLCGGWCRAVRQRHR